jgi:hypothetical protein
MQPQNNPQMGYNLPPAMPNQLPQVGPNQAPYANPEASGFSAEQAGYAAPAGAIPMPPIQPVMPIYPTQPGPMPAVGQTTQSVVPDPTSDADLIEKAWVLKAKQIIEGTKEDPFQQSRNLTILKADYMQKNFNKSIKLGE